MFKESKALRINRKIKPKEIERDERIFFKKMFKVILNAKNNGIKNVNSCTKLACVRLSG